MSKPRTTQPVRTGSRFRRDALATLTLAALAIATLTAIATNAMAAETNAEPDLFEPDTVHAVTRADFEKILEHHRGRVVLVNFWATWCIPCIQELPEIDELQHRYRDRGLQVIAVSFDDVGDLEEKVRPFFAEKAPRLISYLQTEKDPFTFAELLDPDWVGSLPTTFVIDRKGEVKTRVAGRMTFRALEDSVLPLLEESAP